jgi:tetraacyldisaccharide 4'-kinase
LSAKQYIEDLMYGRRKSFWLGPLLLLISALYGLAVTLRHGLYRLGVFKKRALPCRVISVGNITLGGTGKTPAVIAIARLLLKQGQHPAVLSRGYGRERESDLLVVSDGSMSAVDAARGGDEPLLIASKAPGVPVVVGADRYQAGRLALERFRPDVLVLDDGFQHIRLARDLNIALLDASDPVGSGRLFPAGILREPLSALKRADVVLITRADRAKDAEKLKEVIGRHTAARIFASRQSPVDLVDDMTGITRPLSSLRGEPVLAFSGIARPASFFSLLRQLGAVVRTELAYPDHYQYKNSDMDVIIRKAADEAAGLIITTEKDAMRIRALRPRGIWSLRIEQQVLEAKAWERMILQRA